MIMKKLTAFLSLFLISVLFLSMMASAFSLDIEVKTGDNGNQTSNETEETNQTDTNEDSKKPPGIDIADKMTQLAQKVLDWVVNSVLPKLLKSQ